MDALSTLAETCGTDDDFEESARILARAISLEPYAEHMCRQLMIAYGKLGRATDIARVYRELEATLQKPWMRSRPERPLRLRDRLIGDLRQGARRRQPDRSLDARRLSKVKGTGRSSV